MAKYIITENQLGLPCAIVFSEALSHKDVAGNMKVLSAGFYGEVDSFTKQKHVYGYSESLNIASKPNDHQYIELALSH